MFLNYVKQSKTWTTVLTILIMSTIVVMAISISGCESMKRHKETGTSITKSEWFLLSPEEKAEYETTIRAKDNVLSFLDRTGEAIEEGGPTAIALVDLFFPGAGAIAGILGTTFALFKKWKKPLAQEQNWRELIQNGALLTGEAIETLKAQFPDAYAKLGPLLLAQDDAAKEADQPHIMPDKLAENLHIFAA